MACIGGQQISRSQKSGQNNQLGDISVAVQKPAQTSKPQAARPQAPQAQRSMQTSAMTNNILSDLNTYMTDSAQTQRFLFPMLLNARPIL
jgi:hypothetical protein